VLSDASIFVIYSLVRILTIFFSNLWHAIVPRGKPACPDYQIAILAKYDKLDFDAAD